MNAYDKAAGMVTGLPVNSADGAGDRAGRSENLPRLANRWRAVSGLQQWMAELAVGEPQSESKRDETAERQRWLPGRVEIVGVAQPWPLKA